MEDLAASADGLVISLRRADADLSAVMHRLENEFQQRFESREVMSAAVQRNKYTPQHALAQPVIVGRRFLLCRRTLSKSCRGYARCKGEPWCNTSFARMSMAGCENDTRDILLTGIYQVSLRIASSTSRRSR